jgi:pimeloyl-ACP methyl ester carboxylesterase
MFSSCPELIWAKWKEIFEPGFRCVAPSLFQHPASPTDQAAPKLCRVSLEDYAADIFEKVRTETNLILVGHSMGGLIAASLANRLQIRAMVLVAPAAPPVLMPLSIGVVRNFWEVMRDPRFPWRIVHMKPSGRLMTAMLNKLSSSKQGAIRGTFGPESGRAAFELGFGFLSPRRRAEWRCIIAATRCPVLVLAGARDQVTPARLCRRVSGLYANSTYKEFASQAHWLPASQQVAEYARGWLQHTLS